MDYKQLKNEKAISQVNQFIMSISKESQEKIPADLRRFFKENDTHKKEYELDFEHFDESELEEETKAFFCIISKYLKDIDYQEIKPSWKKLEIEGKNKEAIKQLDLELATNFFNISNYYSERELTKVEFIYNIRFFGRSMDIKKSNKLEPFRALCNVFCILHQKYSNTENFDYNEALNQYKYVEHELRNLL